MLFIFRWLLRPLIVMITLICLAAGAFYYLITRSLPDYNETFQVNGITSSVEIIRTDFNIPHIIGGTDHDTFFGLGFAHAQDRLWQMMMLRRYSQGRLSEVFGKATRRVDELMRRYDLYGLAYQSLVHQDAQTLAALEAYSRGVNAWLEIIAQHGWGHGAPERLVFPFRFEKWAPVDSLAVSNLQSVSLANHLTSEVLGQKIVNKLGPEALRDLNPELLPDFMSEFPTRSGNEFQTSLSINTDENGFSHSLGLSFNGSNAWVLAPEKTVAGKSILANDPHLDLTAPSIWYLARLELAKGGVIGATIPGVPVIVLGRTNNLAWGLTSSYADVQDLYFEKLDPSNSSRYLTPTGYKNFDLKVASIRVKGQDNPDTIQLIWTENGPVIPGHFFDLDQITPRDHVVSLAWTLLNSHNTAVSAGLRLMTAKTLDEGLETLSLIHSPSLNGFITDGENIAYQMTGSIPNRNPFHETQGRLPAAGWKYGNRWLGYVSHEDLPRQINPPSRFLVNTNNQPVQANFPNHISFRWGDTKRIERISNILNDRTIHSKESTVQTQTDLISETARTLIPLFAHELWYTATNGTTDTAVMLKRSALELLKNWVGDMDANKPQPLIYSQWVKTTFQYVVQDELGSIYNDYARPNAEFLERVFTDHLGASSWCDIMQTQEQEDCNHIASLALEDTLIELASLYGEDIHLWRWGDAHEIRHAHQALGTQPIFSWLVNITNPGAGGNDTLFRTQTLGSGDNPLASTHGPTYRGIYDFADLDGSLFIIPTGQSGHPFSKNYDDLNSVFMQNKYIPMYMNLDLVRANSIGTNILKPDL